MDSLCYWEPVEVVEDWGDVVSGSCFGEKAGSRVLDILQFFEDFGGGTVEEAIAVVESGCNESMDECFSGGL